MRLIFRYIVVLLLLSSQACQTQKNKQEYKTKTVGPDNGSLILAGGNLTSPQIFRKFMELSGGADKPIVIILTAAADEDFRDEAIQNKTLERFKSQGFKNITLLHTRDPEIANTDSFIDPIHKANALWFTGGRQWRLVDAYTNTRTYDAFIRLLDRGGVIGGSSAGATIQGSYLVRGDTKTNTIMMGDHEEGFGFIKNIAVDQHLLAMNRQYDIFEILDAYPYLLGIGLDENTAIVVQKNEFEVMGEHYVAIYDGSMFTEIRDKDDWSEVRYEHIPLPEGSQKFYLLKKGQKYDMLERKVVF